MASALPSLSPRPLLSFRKYRTLVQLIQARSQGGTGGGGSPDDPLPPPPPPEQKCKIFTSGVHQIAGGGGGGNGTSPPTPSSARALRVLKWWTSEIGDPPLKAGYRPALLPTMHVSLKYEKDTNKRIHFNMILIWFVLIYFMVLMMKSTKLACNHVCSHRLKKLNSCKYFVKKSDCNRSGTCFYYHKTIHYHCRHTRKLL